MAEKLQEGAKAKESGEKLVVQKIYQFTHPEFDSAVVGGGEMHQVHKDLQRRWKEKIDQIAKNPGAILFYVTAFSVQEFQALKRTKREGKDLKTVKLTESESAYEEPKNAAAVDRDLQRILYTKSMLGGRLILTVETTRPDYLRGNNEESPAELLNRRSIKILPEAISTLECFGEYTEDCVPEQRDLLINFLGGKNGRRRKGRGRVNRELSLSVFDIEAFLDNAR